MANVNRRVLPGFSKDQVRAAWGKPERDDGENWVYPAGTVKFAGGNVIQVVKP